MNKQQVPRRVVRMLRELRNAVQWELDAAGEDEVQQHPILRDKARLVDRANKMLKELEG